MENTSERLLRQAEEARAAAVVYEALAAALLNLPDERVLADVSHVAGLLGADGFDEIACGADAPRSIGGARGNDANVAAREGAGETTEGTSPSAALEQRFYDRFFVATSPFFVPLSENSIRSGSADGDVRRFGPTAGEKTDHVLACYRTAGFDPHSLRGHELAVGSARPDSLANELAFMAYLAHAEAAAATEAEFGNKAADTARPGGQAANLRSWQRLFLEAHLGRWAGKAADALAASDDDFYARVVALAAAWIDIDRERVAG